MMKTKGPSKTDEIIALLQQELTSNKMSALVSNSLSDAYTLRVNDVSGRQIAGELGFSEQLITELDLSLINSELEEKVVNIDFVFDEDSMEERYVHERGTYHTIFDISDGFISVTEKEETPLFIGVKKYLQENTNFFEIIDGTLKNGEFITSVLKELANTKEKNHLNSLAPHFPEALSLTWDDVDSCKMTFSSGVTLIYKISDLQTAVSNSQNQKK